MQDAGKTPHHFQTFWKDVKNFLSFRAVPGTVVGICSIYVQQVQYLRLSYCTCTCTYISVPGTVLSTNPTRPTRVCSKCAETVQNTDCTVHHQDEIRISVLTHTVERRAKTTTTPQQH